MRRLAPTFGCLHEMSTLKISYWTCLRRKWLYISKAVLVFAMVLILEVYYLKWKYGSTGVSNELLDNIVQEMIRKDNFHLVTAISTNEFHWLLQFIDLSIAQSKNSIDFEFIILTLNLRTCETEYLKRVLKPKVKLHHFPYNYYPLHIRQYHLSTLKPFVILKTIAVYGETIWLEPRTQLSFLLADFSQTLSNGNLLLASTKEWQTSKQFSVNVIGISMLMQNSHVWRKFWINQTATFYQV